MAVLPAVVPQVPEARSDVVAARVARKIAALFGIGWAGMPYPLTWVCDYSALTVSEIARGAPLPARDTPEPVAGDAEWTVVARAVAGRPAGRGRLPHELASATVNRFGPDTKAALVVTGANTLLAPVTAAVREALQLVVSTGSNDQLPSATRVDAWATLVLDAFATQPALVTAALQARGVQRSHCRRGGTIGVAGLGPTARSEVSGDVRVGQEIAPEDLDVLDATLRSALVGSDALAPTVEAALVDALGERLLRAGGSTSTVDVWIAEPRSGMRQAVAFVPTDPLLTTYVADVACQVRCAGGGAAGRADDGVAFPSVPLARELRDRPLLTRRAVVVAVCAMVRSAFGSGNPEPLEDLHAHATLDAVDGLAVGLLDADDPARLVVRTRVADMRLELLRQDARNDHALPAAVADLLDLLHTGARRARRGDLDPGDAAETAFSANVELLAVLRRHRDRPVDGLPPASALERTLRAQWATTLSLVGLDAASFASDGLVDRALAFHLHNYATFLGRLEPMADAREACRLFGQVVIPRRTTYYDETGDFRPLLHALQNATPAAGRLAEAAAGAGDLAAAQDIARRGRAWIVHAWNSDYARRMLDTARYRASDDACRFALLAAPALLTALELGASVDPQDDRRRVDELLTLARAFAEWVRKSDGGHYSREREIVLAQERLDAVVAS